MFFINLRLYLYIIHCKSRFDLRCTDHCRKKNDYHELDRFRLTCVCVGGEGFWLKQLACTLLLYTNWYWKLWDVPYILPKKNYDDDKKKCSRRCGALPPGMHMLAQLGHPSTRAKIFSHTVLQSHLQTSVM